MKYVILWLLLWSTQAWAGCQDEAVQNVVEEFRQGVNNNDPWRVYPSLSEKLQVQLSAVEFVKGFNKERSYPYLTPLYLYLDDIESTPKGCVAVYTVAARFPGQKMRVPIMQEGDRYGVHAFSEIFDGSYLNKFSKLTPLTTPKN